ncbi:MAG: hypothetical protein KBS36_03645 [Bacteroidales bacterium]|nr:hypothetical protein [Candidatus Cryptobacteroides fimicaballi]
MKFTNKQLLIAGLILGMSFALAACKKNNEEETTTKFLSGSLSTGAPAYAFVGEEITMRYGGLSKEDGDSLLTYIWKISVDDVADTLRKESDPASVAAVKRFTIPDTLGTFRITVQAIASGYASSSATSDIKFLDNTMDGRGSLSGFVVDPDKDIYLTDPRDDIEYLCHITDGQIWMRQNLAYEGTEESGILGVPYDKEPRLSRTFGRYYTWEEAVKACPPGWRLPSEKDWVQLASEVIPDAQQKSNFKDVAGDFLGNIKFNGERMWGYWPNDVTITDRLGFTALPCGIDNVTAEQHNFSHFGDYAAFWTADAMEDTPEALFRYMHSKSKDVFVEYGSTSRLRLNVRCVKDLEEEE